MRKIVISSLILIVICTCKESESTNNPSPESDKFSLVSSTIIDLTHDFSDKTVYWVNAKEFELETVAKGQTDLGFYYSANNFSGAEHGGTHIDAPIHFAENKQSVNEIPLHNLIGNAIKIDVSERALKDRDYLISVNDLKQWEATQQKQIPDGCIVLLQTGYSKFYPDKINYLGTDERGSEAMKLLHFPGLSPEAAKWLVEERNINAIGLDTPSIDYGQSTTFESHVILLSENIPAFENLTNLDQLPTEGFVVIALPMKIKDGSGAPLRIVAFVDNSDKQ
ncbi:kynurenine formamidase [Flavobacteriaceae bacterium MAR_2010_105]|nr:kynurenine formamidase [Flavobacteriaceae bacterium MAR_2010_105]